MLLKLCDNVAFEATCSLTNEPHTESCRNLLPFVALTLFPLQPSCWGAWSARCTCRKKKKKKSLQVHRQNHKSSENSQISTVAVQSARERNKLPPSAQTQTLKCDFVSQLVIVCIYSLHAWLFESQLCTESTHTKEPPDETNALVWFESYLPSFELQMLLDYF